MSTQLKAATGGPSQGGGDGVETVVREVIDDVRANGDDAGRHRTVNPQP